MLKYFMIGIGALFAVIVIAFLIIKKKSENSEIAQIRKLREGTKEKSFSSEVMYQKLYVFYLKTPFFKRYLLKLRRRLAIINVDDEYLTRKQASKILTNTMLIVLPLAVAIIAITKNNTLLMTMLLIFELFMIDTFIDGMVDKLDNKLLKEQIDFFSEIRHAYHEFNMVEEAIYQVAQDDDKPEMSRQAEKIYEVLISNDPESELEKYYDVAPNSYLKEFAGVSYLTKEFGDRKIDNSSLYLKNLNNITQEMQLEILKRDKLDYTFQSLAVISIVPMLFIEPIKNWSISQFSFTEAFYNGRNGMLVQILLLIITFICYILTRKLKDNGSTAMNTKNTENPWQEKLYRVPVIKKFVNLFVQKDGTKEYREKKEKDISTEQLAEVSQWHKYLELQKGRTEDSEHKAFDLYLNNSGFLKEMVMCIEGEPIGKVIWPLYHRTVKPRDIPGHDCVKDNARIKYKLTNEDSNECALIDSVLYNLAVKEIADFAEFKIRKLIEGSKADG